VDTEADAPFPIPNDSESDLPSSICVGNKVSLSVDDEEEEDEEDGGDGVTSMIDKAFMIIVPERRRSESESMVMMEGCGCVEASRLTWWRQKERAGGNSL